MDAMVLLMEYCPTNIYGYEPLLICTITTFVYTTLNLQSVTPY